MWTEPARSGLRTLRWTTSRTSPTGPRTVVRSRLRQARPTSLEKFMYPDGSNQQRLTNNAANDNTPKWSPNSTRIAFLTDRDRGQRFDSREIYIMNADGSGQTNLTNTPGQDPAPWEADESLTGWSPNGSKMVYERNGRIWVMNSDGSGQTDLNQVGNSSAWSPR